MSTATDLRHAVDELYAALAAHDLQPLWTQGRDLMPFHPEPATRAWLWRWHTLRALAESAGELIAIDRGGDRRVLSLSNPGLKGRPFATSTLWGAVQYLGPHESAPAHRHTPGAIRFVLEGDGVWTTVNGDACDMHPGDLVLTPSWNWHDHSNETGRPMIWFDGLDLPTAAALDAIFYEDYPGELRQPVHQAHNASERTFGGRATVPLGTRVATPHSPLLVYRWADTDTALSALLQQEEKAMVSVEFVNPTSGEPALPTLGCEMHRLRSAARTPGQRKVGSSIFVVFRGAGSSVINGERFDWGRGDMFVAPSWALVEHEAEEPTDLFALSDRPVLQRLGLYREETVPQPQSVLHTFQPK
jgi:gentisate 1,2-dioxygenase